MRKFQRAAVVAVAVAGLSFVGAGASSAAGGEDAPPQITAVANSSANAVAVGGGYYTVPQPKSQEHGDQGPQQGDQGPQQGGYDQHQGDE